MHVWLISIRASQVHTAGVSQTLLDCLVLDKEDASLRDAIHNSNARLPKGTAHLKLAASFFSTTPKAATMIDFLLWHSEFIFYGWLPQGQFKMWRSYIECCRVFFAKLRKSAST